MADWSGFTFSGYDPIMSAVQANQNYGLSTALANYNFKVQQALDLTEPGAKRAGLQAAGYNPILAINSGAGSSSANGMPNGNVPGGQGSSGNVLNDRAQRQLMKAQIAREAATADEAAARAAQIRELTPHMVDELDRRGLGPFAGSAVKAGQIYGGLKALENSSFTNSARAVDSSNSLMLNSHPAVKSFSSGSGSASSWSNPATPSWVKSHSNGSFGGAF